MAQRQSVPTIFILSGGVGASGEQVVHTLLAQFPDGAVRVTTVGNVRHPEQIADTLIEVTGGQGETRQANVSRVGDIRHMVANIDRARTLLGYTPHVPLATGLVELIDWLEQQEVRADLREKAKALVARETPATADAAADYFMFVLAAISASAADVRRCRKLPT